MTLITNNDVNPLTAKDQCDDSSIVHTVVLYTVKHIKYLVSIGNSNF